jgi:hypothetical protein
MLLACYIKEPARLTNSRACTLRATRIQLATYGIWLAIRHGWLFLGLFDPVVWQRPASEQLRAPNYVGPAGAMSLCRLGRPDRSGRAQPCHAMHVVPVQRTLRTRVWVSECETTPRDLPVRESPANIINRSGATPLPRTYSFVHAALQLLSRSYSLRL